MLLLTGLLVILSSGVCLAAERYQWITSTDTHGYWFDTQTVKFSHYSMSRSWSSSANKDMIDCWIMIRYNQGGINEEIAKREEIQLSPAGYEKLSHTMQHWLINNKTREMAIIDLADYDTNGKILDSASFPISPNTIIPDSIGEGIANAVTAFVTKNYQTVFNRS